MVLVFIIFLLALTVLLLILFKDFFITPNKNSYLLTIGLVFILVFFICLGFTLYQSLKVLENKTNYNEISSYGNYLGGILTPLISVFTVFAAGFAFYAQYQANQAVQKQFELQQFESRLYKMLDIYNLNVKNLKLFGRLTGNPFEGKAVFSTMINYFNKLKKEISLFNHSENYKIEQIINANYRANLIEINPTLNIDNWSILELTYVIFFYGVGVTGRKNIKSLFSEKYDKDYIRFLLNYLSNKSVEYKSSDELKTNWSNILIFRNFMKPNNGAFDKYYNGHQSNLGHYYRHMYMIIRFINEQKKLDYNQKWEYSKLLRTQLSNHEQVLFFLNSISIIGRDWEYEKSNLNEKLITKYDLIKNIPKGIRDKYGVEDFYPDVVYEDYKKNTTYREYLEKKVFN